MFKKVLIVEDHELGNISLRNTLTSFGINLSNNDVAFHCDVALARVQKAILERQAYELLVTDLSFEDDGGDQKIPDGVELIKVVKQLQPDIKVLIFSFENRAFVAKALFNELGIDAFVPKARHDARDLKSAMETIYKDKKYLSPNLKQAVKEEATYDFTAFDKKIIALLSSGEPQKNIPFYLQREKFKPSGLSSVEKRLNRIKTVLNISNNEQLIAYCKDRNII